MVECSAAECLKLPFRVLKTHYQERLSTEASRQQKIQFDFSFYLSQITVDAKDENLKSEAGSFKTQFVVH